MAKSQYSIEITETLDYYDGLLRGWGVLDGKQRVYVHLLFMPEIYHGPRWYGVFKKKKLTAKNLLFLWREDDKDVILLSEPFKHDVIIEWCLDVEDLT